MRRYTTGALVAAALLTFTACGGGDAADEAVEAGIEEALGSNADVEIDGDGNMAIETEDGSYAAGDAAEVPDDFPAEVPLPDDAQLATTFSDATNWLLTYQADGITDESCVGYIDGFTAAGFTEESRFTSAGSTTGVFSNADLQVTVGCGEAMMGISIQVSATGG